ncbi:hypothetical protein F441_11613 [Phytophthora nicotianae CJ01A1]|uniref:Uncharacterized protein n=6 Tax=Phytophthora nicotianae TaxID=4792 RepID=W2Q2Y0_PHYN3|nr:hypothetical protein PPTG_23281 [Phytophthora nicotianae INRA-310]ETI43335.1 hypothetical protein F443_11679 [Phytophthora nicotianae P1569]ETL36823.1 hypothetical protein L916_11274 [Phytophthora nicotianae]ETO72004.1 hypothetical protein F444_11759 [Phytophthora nicotianae P1976]ETP13140.1 hypothetical protein F441_11613 [Phytophthora nicotianae CJ01A1]ETP41220.1 hypothetical protein F442_11578 [Phytophthora nicotianae P10297]
MVEGRRTETSRINTQNFSRNTHTKVEATPKRTPAVKTNRNKKASDNMQPGGGGGITFTSALLTIE